MDETSIIAQEMQKRYRDEKGKTNEAEEHNYTKTREMFIRELSAYFSDKPVFVRNLEIAVNHGRDPFAVVDDESIPPNKGFCQDPRLATTGDNRGTPENTPRKALTQARPSDSGGPVSYPPSAYCCVDSKVNPKNVAINTIGILYEFRNYFFSVFHVSLSKDQEVSLPRYGFVPRWAVGRYLRIEWEMLEKREIGLGAFGTGGLVAVARKKEWNVHSAKIQRMRAGCCEKANEVAVWWLSRPHLNPVESHVIQRNLEHVFREKMHEIDVQWERNNREELEDAEKFMEKFMVFEE